jgi:hypothetical protein
MIEHVPGVFFNAAGHVGLALMFLERHLLRNR